MPRPGPKDYWLKQLKEAKQAGYDDYAAAEIAEKATLKKYDKLPKTTEEENNDH
jgi:hypothetical protein